MYMIKGDNSETYTIAEFRSKLRDAFESADDMIDVFVIRHGKRYFLCTEDYLDELQKPDEEGIGLKPPPVAKKPKVPAIIKSPQDAVVAVKQIFSEAKEVRLCSIHGIPLDSWGKCLQKNCKYA